MRYFLDNYKNYNYYKNHKYIKFYTLEDNKTIEKEVTPKDFGRVAAGAAKQVVTQRIREAVEKETISYNNHNIKVTISMGISIKNQNIKNFKEFIKFADINLYKAKESGRNRIIL